MLFEVPNIQLARALNTARAWEISPRQAGGKEKNSVNLVQYRASKEKPTGQGMHKCYACRRSGHFTRDKVCPAKGKAACEVWQKRALGSVLQD